MFSKASIKELKAKIGLLQAYLGPRVNYSSDSWPGDQVDRWLLEYLLELKQEYYQRLGRQKKRRKARKISDSFK